MTSRILAAALLVGLALLAARSPAGPRGERARARAPTDPVRGPQRAEATDRASAEGLLDRARDARRRGDRKRAVEDYRALRRHFPDESALGAEAAFRAGEILRADDCPGEALVEFRAATRLGEGTDFRARGLIEEGHLHRRAGRSADALAAYLRVVASAAASERWHTEALLWAGRTARDAGRPGEARTWFERVALDGRDPAQRIRAFDAWALVFVDEDDLEAAAGVLDRCARELGRVLAERTETGERARRALKRTVAVERLSQAVRERRRRRASE